MELNLFFVCCFSFVLLFGFFPQLLMNKQIGLKRYEVDGRKVLFYFDEVKTFFVSLVSLVSASK